MSGDYTKNTQGLRCYEHFLLFINYAYYGVLIVLRTK